MSSKLFTPLQVGSMNLKHRLVLAPLTRFRADDSHVPLPFVKDYYAQRASLPGTLLITEATFISPRASGYPNVPGIWNSEQARAWKEVTDAVHAKGSYIFVQLWALGRTANPAIKAAEGTGDVISSSPTPMAADKPTPRELTEKEIWEYVADYAAAARLAVEEAGFDGVEIHGANGYLVDQFIQDRVNTRTDRWGGSIENRARFAFEVTKAVVKAVGSDKTGIRLSPWSMFQGMRMADPVPQFKYVIEGLRDIGLAYLHLVSSRVAPGAHLESREGEGDERLDFAFEAWRDAAPVLLAGGFKPESARATVDEELRDRDVAIVFGRLYISNPDLPFKILKGLPLTPYNRDTFYNPKSEEGYIDQPFSKEYLESEAKL
ncbi:FMN-linked oxidoreductase [Glonium stellatum]|uniref:FMN-linked oxidoreductase n=1 Tax=Glonium stellatum TaxID=574774 RepID=A0A8E2ENC0_9PEZI|nr:FMN-linked oxidoreductase [Glonium stellatum]